MNGEVIRLIDVIQKEKNLEKNKILQLLEESISLALQESFLLEKAPDILINSTTGEISVSGLEEGKKFDQKLFTRLVHSKVKDIFLEKLSNAESELIYLKYKDRRQDVVLCHVIGIERGDVICEIDGEIKAILPRKEQIPGDSYRVGSRFKAIIINVAKKSKRVKGKDVMHTEIMLSRTCPEFVKKLLEIEIPEVANKIIRINKVVREPGYRAKVAVNTTSQQVHSIGACVGLRGSRMRGIINELGGENIDIVEQSDDPAKFITNAFKPAEISEIHLNEKRKRARVYVQKEFLPQAIGKGGRNVRLASLLTGWDISVMEASASGEVKKDEKDTKKSS